MKKINRILYATDFSQSSNAAADYALTLAELAGATLHVLHVIGEMADARRSLIPASALEQLEKNVELHALKEMETFCRDKFAGRIEYRTQVVVGIPFKEILTHSAAEAVDLIVLGTHGRTGIEHVIVGSTSERVVRRSTIPVLVVRNTD